MFCRWAPGFSFLFLSWAIPLSAAASAEIAQAGGPPPPQMVIKRMDTDGDGKISREEFRGPPPRFDKMDADKDGFITLDEIKAFQASLRRESGEAGDAGGGSGPKKGPNGEIFLTADQLRDLVTGTEISHVSPRSGSPVEMTFLSGGNVSGTVGSRRGRQSVTGTWEIKQNGQLCFDVEVLGNRICFYLVRKGRNLVRYNKDGQPAKGIDWTIVKAGPNANKVP